MGMVAILVMWPGSFEQTHSPIPRKLHVKFDFDWPSGFWGEDVWRMWMTTMLAYLSYKLTNKPSAQGELKTCQVFLQLGNNQTCLLGYRS